ncbi:secreted triacylglycerol lipase [Phycomyces blakesleeanus]|uniref:Secreted triacylglycerol lipase n=2 Tax=Phycomyces blakesleeanus TaxID=4837 RepID=A0A167LKQ2_PHYB8|nr:secreted triacylglycerol lipase [Phycomyces blakesleeanus NRRL 1555(-)]OAD70657.1 secreted triacylglycerol lipase [Phycomyces blakesleeanus NRRL 1555(-)]|eukprot:XP_018288697.1 secreted triacylglycerol lipase [Phycomyces blakesleeanus NRRL 1555(-)]
MKLTSLSIIAVVMFFVYSPVSMATPTANNTLTTNATRSFTVPPVIAQRATVPSEFSYLDMVGQKLDTKINTPLPRNVDQADSMDFNSSAANSNHVNSRMSRRATFYASYKKVKELKGYAQNAANAYCRSVVPMNTWVCEHCSRDESLVSTFKSGSLDTNGYIIRNDKTGIISLVFRGTSSFANVIADADFSPTSYPPVKGTNVHNGFYNAYMSVQKDVLSEMTQQITDYPHYRVVVTGHSLGGALAILGGLDLFQRDSRFDAWNLSIVTFGGPRVGDPAFAHYVVRTGIPITRVIHNQDIVPHVPPQYLGFLHPGTEYWITDEDRVKICRSELDSSQCSNSIVPFTKLRDHLTYFGIDTGTCT